ncbi:MAG: type II toxin-antitoxin system YafO family toxin [Endozoicomonas sp.]|uniref:type II toxin-antitoxin system YafO family toxin n=1 Tax=Endozoicomonas sp. TaxID=1892382 RepID=UPI003D9B1747
MSRDEDVKIYTRRTLHELSRENKQLQKIIEDFKAYKKGYRVRSFGRDAPFHRPKPSAELAELMHVHLMHSPKAQLLDVVKVSDPYYQTSDSFLIYSKGFFNPEHYYIIDYIEKDAHAKVEDMNYMRWLIDQAESFRKSR